MQEVKEDFEEKKKKTFFCFCRLRNSGKRKDVSYSYWKMEGDRENGCFLLFHYSKCPTFFADR